jgi:hypothetical protein
VLKNVYVRIALILVLVLLLYYLVVVLGRSAAAADDALALPAGWQPLEVGRAGG